MTLITWYRMSRDHRAAATTAFHAADRALQNYRQDTDEITQDADEITDEYLRLLKHVNDLWDTVPIWTHWAFAWTPHRIVFASLSAVFTAVTIIAVLRDAGPANTYVPLFTAAVTFAGVLILRRQR